MQVTKCDLCKKKIDFDKAITAGLGIFRKTELCEKCGSPILRFLKKHKFIEKETKENKK